MRRLVGKITDFRITTKIVLSSVMTLALTAAVGLTGLYFVDVMQARMDRAAQSSESMSAVLNITAELERLAVSADPASASEIQTHIASRLAAISQSSDTGNAASAGDIIGSAQTALSQTAENVTTVAAVQARIQEGRTALEAALQDFETKVTSLHDLALTVERDAKRLTQDAQDKLVSGSRVLASLDEVEASYKAIRSALSPKPDNAKIEAAEAVIAKAVRKLRPATAKDQPDAQKQLEAKVAAVKEILATVKADPTTSGAVGGALGPVFDTITGMRATALGTLKSGTEALSTAQTTVLVSAGVSSGIAKLGQASQRLMAETLRFMAAPSDAAIESLTASSIQIKQITDVLAADGKGLAKIDELGPILGRMLGTIETTSITLIKDQAELGTALTAARSSLSTASAAVSQLVEMEKTGAAMDRDYALSGIVGTLIVGVAVSALVGFGLIAMIRKPVRRLTHAMSLLAEGNTDIVLDGADRHDEIGDMNRAVAVFRDHAIERDRLNAAADAEQGERARRQTRIEETIRAFDSNVVNLLAAMTSRGDDLQATARSLSDIASSAAERAETANAASYGASSSVQTVASAAEELNASIEAISSQVGSTRSVVENAKASATGTNEKVGQLSAAATRIGDVVQLISSIAAQTNLLALNATIEAARAGEAGRGFSIVASEVKGLANQTAKATEDIAALINDIQMSSGETVTAIGAIVGTMEEIYAHTAEISQAIDQQGAATMEISESVQTAASGTEEVVSNIAHLGEMVGRTSKTVQEVSTASEELRHIAASLRSTIDSFLREVAAA